MDDTDLDKIAKGWSIATFHSEDRLRRAYHLEDAQMQAAREDGRLALETLCLFIHACIRPGQYRPPLEFWRIMHAEYGIMVYPSAMTEDIEVQGWRKEVTFTDAYCGHVVMDGPCSCSKRLPECPIRFLLEPPPVYEK